MQVLKQHPQNELLNKQQSFENVAHQKTYASQKTSERTKREEKAGKREKVKRREYHPRHFQGEESNREKKKDVDVD